MIGVQKFEFTYDERGNNDVLLLHMPGIQSPVNGFPLTKKENKWNAAGQLVQFTYGLSL